jgi:class 3 adenylate cyclase
LSSTSESVVTIELNTRNRIEIERGCGSEIDTTGDGVLALFDSPTPAGMCPLALIAATGLDLAHPGRRPQRRVRAVGTSIR